MEGLCLQIYVEIERARLTKRYAQIKESEGDVNEAAEILQEVAVVGPSEHLLSVLNSLLAL